MYSFSRHRWYRTNTVHVHMHFLFLRVFVLYCLALCSLVVDIHIHVCIMSMRIWTCCDDPLPWFFSLLLLCRALLQNTNSARQWVWDTASHPLSISAASPPPPPLLISYTAHHAPQRLGNNYISTIQLTVCLICEFMLLYFHLYLPVHEEPGEMEGK